ADHLKHLRGGRLPFQRLGEADGPLAEVVGALAQFVEEPCVLDGDDGLSCEALEKLDFPVVESSYLLTVDNYCPHYFAVLQHRHYKHRSHARELRKGSDVLVGWVRSHIFPYIRNVDQLFGLSRAQQRTCSGQRFALAKLSIGRRCVVLCHYAKGITLIKRQGSEVSLAQSRGVGQNGIEQAVTVAV